MRPRESGFRQGICTRFIAISRRDGNPNAGGSEKKVRRYNYKETLLFFCAAQHIFEATDAKKIVTDM